MVHTISILSLLVVSSVSFHSVEARFAPVVLVPGASRTPSYLGVILRNTVQLYRICAVVQDVGRSIINI